MNLPAFLRRTLVGMACLASVGLAPGAQAEGPSVYISSDGQAYTIRCNANGFVMRSRSNGQRYYFGRSCDTFNKRIGGGHWCSGMGSAAGFWGYFGPYRLDFAGYEPYCPGVGWLSGVCPCS